MALAKQRTVSGAAVTDRSNDVGIEVAPDVWIRKRGIGTVLYVGYAAASSLFFASGGIALLLSPWTDGSVASVVVFDLACGAMAALSLRFAVRMARAGLRISADGVLLRGVLRTHRLPLAAVEGFKAGSYPGGALRTEAGVNLVLREGRSLRVWAMRKGAPTGRRGLNEALADLQPLCDELNGLLQEMKGDVVDSADRASKLLGLV
jgi:hypothetical protein